jgi:hypothetical protein
VVYKFSEETFIKRYPLFKRIPFFNKMMTAGEEAGKGWLATEHGNR